MCGRRRSLWGLSALGSKCSSCGDEVGVVRRLFSAGLCATCAGERQRLHDSARAQYERRVATLASGSTGSGDPDVSTEERLDAGLSERELHSDQVFRRYAKSALADDLLDEHEETYLLGLAVALGLDQEALERRHGDVLERLSVARVNDGRMPTVEQPSLVTAGAEVVHAEAGAVMVEATSTDPLDTRQTNTLPVGRGMRYRIIRPLAPLASIAEIETLDAGLLAVTSNRVVFTGERTCRGVLYRRLLNVQVFSDAIRFDTVAAGTGPVFMLGPVDAIGATIGAAAERAM
jgi:hypothetical protein